MQGGVPLIRLGKKKELDDSVFIQCEIQRLNKKFKCGLTSQKWGLWVSTSDKASLSPGGPAP